MPRSAILLAALAVVVTACGATVTESVDTGDEPTVVSPTTTTTTTEPPPTTTTTGAPAPAALTLAAAESDLGTIIVDGDGNTLYLFTPDNQGDSVCYDQCAEAWPPLTGIVTAGNGLDDTLFGTAPRTDGDDQVTYNGWPLYYFVQDTGPGDTNGQGVNNVWYVLDAAGNGIGVDG